MCAALGNRNEPGTRSPRSGYSRSLPQGLVLGEIDSDFLAVSKAAKAEGVDLGERLRAVFIGSCRSSLIQLRASCTASRTKLENCRQLQAVFTTQGVYYAAQGTLALEAQLGISQPK